jgi:hypothetical protein
LRENPRAPDLLEDAVGERRAFTLQNPGAGFLDDPFDVCAGGLDHAAGRPADLGTDAVAGDQGDQVRHGRTLADEPKRAAVDS